jgi:hypothetical protein
MSVISNIHTATPYDAKQSKPFAGQRLVKTIAKKDVNGNYGPHLQVTMCTSIPTLTTKDATAYMEENEGLDAHIVSFLWDTQNALIGARIKSGQKSVRTEELEIPALVEFLNASGDSDKWDTARVAQWFTDNLAEHIGTRLIELGATDEVMEKKLAKAQQRFAEAFGTRSGIGRTLAVELQKILHFAQDTTDPQVKRFQAKLDKAMEEKSLEESLGF